MKKTNKKFFKKIKKDFPIFKNNRGLIYLDSAATTQKPKVVIDKIKEFYEKNNCNLNRSNYNLFEKSLEEYENSRKNIAKFINSKPEEIIFTKNTTESINILSNVLKDLLKKGKNEILLTEMEHHSNLIPWQSFCKKNKMNLKFVKIKKDFTLDLDDLKNKVGKNTGIFSFTHVSNVLGTINPVEKILKIIKKYDIVSIIDSAQAIPSIKIDVKKIGCDFLVFSGHKILGPNGVGVLYGKKEFLEKINPLFFGGGMAKKVDFYSFEPEEIPKKFEAGTQNYAEIIAFSKAIDYIKEIGIENITKYEKNLTKYAISKLEKINGIKIYNPGFKKSGGIVSFTINGIHPHDISEILSREKILIRTGNICAMPLLKKLGVSSISRISFYIYNDLKEIDKFVNSLIKINEKFSK